MYVCRYDVKKECTNAFMSMYKNCTECILCEIRHEIVRLRNDNPSLGSSDIVEREKVLKIIDAKVNEVKNER